LNGGIDNSTTSVVVTDGSVFPAVGNFRIKIDDELFVVTARSTNTLTVATRPAESTTAASHNNLAVVTHILTAGSYYQTVADNVRADVIADRQAAAKAGRLWIPTNGNRISRDTGAAWNSYGPIFKLTETPAVAADFTWRNQGSTTAVDQGGSIYIEVANVTTTSIHTLWKNAPGSTPYHIIACFRATGSLNTALYQFGLSFLEASSNKIYLFGFRFGASVAGSPQIFALHYTSDTGEGTAIYSSLASHWNTDTFWTRIGDDGTTLTFDLSLDGINWLNIASEARGAQFSATGFPDQVGFFGEARSSVSHKMPMTLLSWEQTS